MSESRRPRRHAVRMGETWIEDEYPYNGFRRGLVRFPDGKTRIVRLAQTADTFFTIRGRSSHHGAGYVYTDTEREEFAFQPNGG